jgi:Asp-tRNA(Asn)/Glu-tRNA(Gln) amidotransferase C subunit
MDVKKIERDAKAIMDEFSAALDELALEQDIGVERNKQVREPSLTKPDLDFRERMFENAPKKSDEFIVAEKKKW